MISLKTATELIVLTLLINKASGIYGMLALLTGYHLSWAQLSMYIYSIIILGLVCYLAPHIKRQSALQCLALAWIYVIDSIINVVYTGLFGATWFILLARHLTDDSKALGPGGKMMNDTAGFTDAEHSVSSVEVVAAPANGAMAAQDAVAIGKHDGSALGSAVFQGGSIMSISVIGILWMVRLYFILVVMAYARGVLRQHIVAKSASSQGLQSGSKSSDMAENPFAEGSDEGQGWKGKLGRAMTRVLQSYWLGKDDEDEWVRGAGERFKKLAIKVPQPGVGERERRARSGTGPPPAIALKKLEKREI